MPYGSVKVWLWPSANGITHVITWKSFDKKEWRDFLEMFKATISASNRMYDPQTKLWQIDNKVVPGFRQLIDSVVSRVHSFDPNVGKTQFNSPTPKIDPNNFFYNTVAPAQAQTRESVTESLARILGCTPTDLGQPLDIVKKLYRKKALELHPDRNNGDGSKMSELNSLWSVFNA
jgi:hypothetical protein